MRWTYEGMTVEATSRDEAATMIERECAGVRDLPDDFASRVLPHRVTVAASASLAERAPDLLATYKSILRHTRKAFAGGLAFGMDLPTLHASGYPETAAALRSLSARLRPFGVLS